MSRNLNVTKFAGILRILQNKRKLKLALKIRHFNQKSRMFSRIENFVKNRNFFQDLEFLFNQLKFALKIDNFMKLSQKSKFT